MSDKIEGFLEVGTLNGEVVVNHPDLKPDDNGVGHIIFSPNQARNLARLLLQKAEEIEMETRRREDAEKNRRGLGILKEKSEQHGAQVCTISGKPPDPDYAELHNAPQPLKNGSGQHADYYVLCPEERAKGFVRPVRQSYIHDKCHTKTHMGLALAETYARDPKFYGATFCCHCGTHYPVAEFKWEDGEVLGS